MSSGDAQRGRLAEALTVFTQRTELHGEHRRLMDEHRKPVPWEQSGAAGLSVEMRAGLADLWRARMISEHRSVGVFNLYALDLAGAGAPAEALSLACRAALDEVRHAELFGRLASLYSGEPETPPPGIPPMPDDASVPLSHQVAREALFLCVCSETYSAGTLAEIYERASDPVVKAAVGIVLADEILHARMGWSLLATTLAEPSKRDISERLQAELIATFDGFVEDMFGDPRRVPEPSLRGDARVVAERHGYLATRDEYALFVAMIDEVWIPGLGALGLDARALRGRYPAPSASAA